MNGPLRAEWSRRYAEPGSPPLSFDFTSCESTTPPIVKVRIVRKADALAVFGRLKTTVVGSVALTLSAFRPAMSVKRNAGDLFSLIARWTEYTTSSAVRALPLANFCPDLSLNVMSFVDPVSLMSQLVARPGLIVRSEEHTSELQSHSDLVCRLLLEK